MKCQREEVTVTIHVSGVRVPARSGYERAQCIAGASKPPKDTCILPPFPPHRGVSRETRATGISIANWWGGVLIHRKSC